jgi:glycosyltransferase involved in cell wall biosynthesis
MGVPKPQLARLIAQTSNRVYFASQAISNDWTAELANLQTRVVFNWTEVNKRQDAPEISDSVAVGYLNDPGVFVIAIIGSLVEWKRQADAVEAVGNLLRDGLNVALLVVGPEVDANYAGRLRQLAALQVHPERIRFCGYTESPEPVMREADLCLVCSDKEPFGRVTIESMAQGTPVVGTNSGGTPEIIRDGVNGLLYPTGDVNALTQCLRLLATNPVRHAELAAGARDDRRFTNPGRAMAPVISELIELRGQSNPASAVAAFFNRGLNEIQLESRATNSLDQRAKRFVKMLLGRR